MSRILAIFLFLIISAQAVHQGLIYAYFVTNKAYIVENLCENKDVPELKCDGKCHLRQVLSINQKESTPEQPPVPQLEEIKPLVLYCERLMDELVLSYTTTASLGEVATRFSYCFLYDFKPITAILDPPRQ